MVGAWPRSLLIARALRHRTHDPAAGLRQGST